MNTAHVTAPIAPALPLDSQLDLLGSYIQDIEAALRDFPKSTQPQECPAFQALLLDLLGDLRRIESDTKLFC